MVPNGRGLQAFIFAYAVAEIPPRSACFVLRP